MRLKKEIIINMIIAKRTLKILKETKIKTIHKNPLRAIEYDIKYTLGQINVLNWLLKSYIK